MSESEARSDGVIAVSTSAVGDGDFRFTRIEHYVELMGAVVASADAYQLGSTVVPATAGLSLWRDLPLIAAIIADPMEGDERIPYLRDRGVPLVTIGRDPERPYGGFVVESDYRDGTQSVLDHLAERGAERPALIGWPERDWFTSESMSTYGHWCSDRGLEPLVELVPTERDAAGQEPKRLAAKRFLARDPRPRAAYCLCEGIAFELVAEAAEQGIDIPGELLVATIGDHGLAKVVDPQLTTLESEPQMLGFRAVEMVMGILEHPKRTEANVIVETTLIPRRSSQPAGQDAASSP